MKILLHEYGGHAFPVQLSRSLAKRGHTVVHLYSASIATPRGVVDRLDGDPENMIIKGITLEQSVNKYNYLVRRQQELEYARRLCEEIERQAPEIVIAATTTIDVLLKIRDYCHRHNVPWILWLQDIQSVAIKKYAPKKLPVIGHFAAMYYAWKEKFLIQDCAEVIVISDGFIPVVEEIAGPVKNISVIENWASLEDITPQPKDNPWAVKHALNDKFCFVYSGTMGLKHNPRLLAELARHYASQVDVRIVVVSKGLGADYLARDKEDQGLDNLVILPWQPYPDLPNVLGSADVLVVVLEEDAGVLSVPSKVTSNMCAGRAQLLAVPEENLAAKIVQREKAGIVVAPRNIEAFVEAAESLYRNRDQLKTYSENGRRYAEQAYNLDSITDKFEAILAKALT